MVEQPLPATATLKPETAAASEAQSPTTTTRSSSWPTDGQGPSEPPRHAAHRVRRRAAAAAHQTRVRAAVEIQLLHPHDGKGASHGAGSDSKYHTTNATGARNNGMTGTGLPHFSDVSGSPSFWHSAMRTTPSYEARAGKGQPTYDSIETPVVTPR